MSGRALSKAEMVALAPHARENLLWYVSQVTDEDRLLGLGWYRLVHNKCIEMAEQYGLTLDTTIRVVACLSPQLPWVDNLMAAETVIRYFLAGGLVPDRELYLSKAAKLVELGRSIDLFIPANVIGPNKVKALWILQGYSDCLSGPKVNSFYHNILHHNASGDVVTVDTHAIGAWARRHETPESLSVSCDQHYRIIEADYVWLASVLNMTVEETQSLLWVIYRRLSGADRRLMGRPSNA